MLIELMNTRAYRAACDYLTDVLVAFDYQARIIFLVIYCPITIILIVLVLRGHYTKIPLIGNLAEKFANRVNKRN